MTHSMPPSLLLNILIEPRFKAVRHFLLALLIIFIAFQNTYIPFQGIGLVYALITSVLIIAVPIYSNLYILIPCLIRKKFSLYIAGLLLTGVISLIAQIYLLGFLSKIWGLYDQLNNNTYSIINILYFMITIIMITAGMTSIELFQRWVMHNRKILELEKTTMQSELRLLRNQINPHFLFNMLNNANILVKENPEEASGMLLKFDELLQYLLNGSNENEVSLSADILFLSRFLELEKTRRDDFEFTISKELPTGAINIPPLLFIPFVENAVKHNSDSENRSYVHLYFKVENKELFFSCENSKPRIPVSKERGGLGLANIKRRLELLYGDHHSLELRESETTYIVNLYLKL